jgi:2-iminobutanoate/2-iminopropanoate deaminase
VAIEVGPGSRLLVIGGLNGYLADGATMPDSFAEQGDVIYAHLGAILRSAWMDFDRRPLPAL